MMRTELVPYLELTLGELQFRGFFETLIGDDEPQ